MAPRSIWTGAISFGLVNVPIKLTSATRSHDVRFNQLRRSDGSRIKQRRVAEADGEEVPYEEIVKGYEVSPGRYVVISPEELESVAPKATRLIEIEDVVALDAIDPLHYESAYYLVPDKNADRAYALLAKALADGERVAVGRVVLRQKEYLVALRALDGVLTLSTMRFADEIVPRASLEGIPDPDSASEKELAIAEQLLESLSGPFEPERYRDTYRDEVLAMIERKGQGETIEVEAPAAAEPKVLDLMAALEASLADAKKRRLERSDDATEAKAKAPRTRRRASA